MIRKYFITGLLVLIPLAITLWVLHLVVATMDRSLLLLPSSWRPDALVGFHIHGSGVILTLGVILLTGLLAQNFIGAYLHGLWERMLRRIPVVNSVYFSVKQVSDTLFSSNGNAFRKAVLIEYPRPGIWTVAFLTGVPGGEVKAQLPDDCVSLYVPTTPNPTSGFFLIARRSEVFELDMSVDTALKYVVSMGVVAPPELTEPTGVVALPEREEPMDAMAPSEQAEPSRQN